MSIESSIVELINADIDGEISAEDRALLQDHLDRNPEARRHWNELSNLCEELDSMADLAAPDGMQEYILAALPRRNAAGSHNRATDLRNMLNAFFGGGAARYAFSFAAGAILTYAVINSEQVSRQALDDVSGLVGTISQQGRASGETVSEDSIRVNLNEIAGSVALNSSGSIMTLDFDLASPGPIEIVTSFADRDIWFNGFAQLESSGTTIAAEEGSVTVRMEGRRRYAVYLNTNSRSRATIGLRFYSGGTLIHEDELDYGANN